MNISPSATIRCLPINRIIPNPRNADDRWTGSEDDLSLAQSIKANGLRQPIVVIEQADDTFMLLHGERRWRSCMLNGDRMIEAVVHLVPPVSEADAILTENLARKNLSSWEALTALEERVMHYRAEAEKALMPIPSVQSIAGRLGIAKRMAQRLWTVTGHLDERSRDTIVGNPILRQKLSLSDLERIGRTHFRDRPNSLKKLAEAYGEFDHPHRARRACAVACSAGMMKFTICDEGEDRIASCTVMSDSTRPVERIYTPALDLAIRVNPLVDVNDRDARQLVASAAREILERILLEFEGPRRRPQVDSEIVLVPTRTFDELSRQR